MPFIRFLALAILLNSGLALSGEVEIIYKKNNNIRTIWVPPNYPKMIVLPGDLAHCIKSSGVIELATADAFETSTGKWIREIAVGLQLKNVTKDNVYAIENAVHGVQCKFQAPSGKYVQIMIPIKIDTYNKHGSEEVYVFSFPERSYLSDVRNERVKSYRVMKLEKDKLVIPSEGHRRKVNKVKPFILKKQKEGDEN